MRPTARGRSRHPDPPRQPRPDRPAADPRRGRCVRARHGSRCLRAAGRPAARVAPLRRAPGAAVARPGALCRHQRLREGRPPIDLALSRLGHPGLQRRHALRPVHDRADRRRPAPGRDARPAHRHRLPSQHHGQHGRRDRRRGVPGRGDRRSGQHHDAGLDGDDHGLCPVPRPQVRPLLAAGVFPALRVLQQHRRPRREHRARGRPPPEQREAGRDPRRAGRWQAELDQDDQGQAAPTRPG